MLVSAALAPGSLSGAEGSLAAQAWEDTAVESMGPLPRPTSVRRLGTALVALLGGCTATEPEFSQELQVDDQRQAAAAEPAIPGAPRPRTSPPPLLEQPVPAAEPEPAATPSLIVAAREYGEDELRSGEGCVLTVTAKGFPAISADGDQVVVAELEVDDGSTDDSDGIYSVTWISTHAGAGRFEEIYNSAWFHKAQDNSPDEDPCPGYLRRARKSAREVNAALKEDGWRPLSLLDVELPDPYADEETKAEQLDPMATEASKRPVEILWRRSRFIARTRGVKVYINEQANWENDAAKLEGYGYDPCDYEPALGAVYGDRITGTLLVEYDHDRPRTSCLCGAMTLRDIVHAPPELFDRLDELAELEASDRP